MRIARQWSVQLSVLLFCACSADASTDTARAMALAAGSSATVPPSQIGKTPPTVAVSSEPTGPLCGKTDLEVSKVVPQVMLLVDGSASMRTSYGTPASAPAATPAAGMSGGRAAVAGSSAAGSAGAGGAAAPMESTRWTAIRQALINPTTGVVPLLSSTIKFGLAVFSTDPTCPFPVGVVDPALNNYERIAMTLPPNAPGTRTPTGRALDQIVDRLSNPAAGAPMEDANSPRIIVLATDGDPNSCEVASSMPDYEPSIQAALKAQSRGQRMFVISVGQEAAKDHLQQLANIGAGMPRMASPGATVFYPSDPAGLASTLQTLIGTVALCEVTLDGMGVTPGSECLGQVTLNGAPLVCNDPNGWKLSDSTHVQLQGSACEAFKNGSNGALKARFPCESLVPQ